MSKIEKDNKVGLISLIGIIIGAMIGGGAFSLATDMSNNAGLLAIIIGWIITGAGMIALALVYQVLVLRKPTLVGGIYSYAKEGFGEYLGFNSAWGYWISAFLGNVAYSLFLFNSLGYFFPIFNGSHNIFVVVGASLLVWLVHFIALRGVQQVVIINIITLIARLLPVFVGLVVMLFVFKLDTLTFDFHGLYTGQTLFQQIKNTMMVTVWVFIGVEGAVVLSERAKVASDIGKATMIGLLLTLLIYILLNILTMAAVPHEVLVTLKNPTLAYALEYIIGPFGAWFVNIGLCVALFGALLGWTLLASEVPYIASKDSIFPKFLSKENSKKAPVASLWFTNGAIQLFLIISYFSSGTYQTLYMIASVAILPPYLLSALYGLLVAYRREGYQSHESNVKDIVIASIASIYGVWLIYAANISLLVIYSIFCVIGTIIFVYPRYVEKRQLLVGYEKIIALVFAIAAICGIFMIINGNY